MHRTKKIGVFISHIYGNYQSRLCSGIIEKASEYGYLVEIFASNDGENLGDYGKGEFSILNIPRPDDYAGIIIASDTFVLPSLKQALFKLLKECFTCPVIDITQKSSEYPRIVLENNKPVRDVVIHLGKRHHCKKICYLGSLAESDNNILRQQSFLEGLEELSLPAKDTVYACDYSRESIELALKHILDSQQLPDAIVCYNDRIALSVITMLKERDLRIPEQIAITGCDTLEFGQMTAPILTSVTFPSDEVGKMAAMQLARLIRRETVEPFTTVNAVPSFGTSCGCPAAHPISSYFYTRKLDEHIMSLEQNMLLNMHMSANLQCIDDLDTGIELLAEFALSLPDCREFYLCLYEDWDQISHHIREITFTEEEELCSDTVLLKLAIKNGKRLPECTFTKRSILPDYLYDSNSSSYIYTPLFFGEKSFGYLALTLENSKSGYPFFFLSWLMNVNNMLMELCDKKNLGLLVGRLEDIYTKDELTGLLNRQGFKLASVPAVNKAIADQTPVCAFMFDLDGLKTINNTFGHEEGNFAISVLAHALENSTDETAICSRQGGDEFWVLAFDYTPEKASSLMNHVTKYLNNYNKLHPKEYQIQTSCGYAVKVPESYADLTEMFREADLNMYAQKQSKNE